MRTVLSKGPISRADIADHLGLTRGTVTRVAGELLGANLLHELAPARSAFGRPMVPLDINAATRAVVTVHLGAAEIRVGLVDLRGVILHERRAIYTDNSPESVVDLVADHVYRVITDCLGSRQLLGLGVCIGGWVDTDNGEVVHYAPLGWKNVPLQNLLADRLNLPLFFDQMFRGIALAEMMFGAARGAQDFVEIYVGNIVGAASIDRGWPRRGPRGAAGIISHMPVRGVTGIECSCGRIDCLESIVTDTAVLEDAVRVEVAGAGDTVLDIIANARSGHSAATALLERRSHHLGTAVASVVDLLNPSLLVLAGRIARTPEYLPVFEAALSAASEHAVDVTVPVLLSTLGEGTPTVGCAALFLDAFYRDPFAYLG